MVKPSLKEKYSEPKTEVLAGGFVYRYPYYKEGTWYFSPNVLEAARFSLTLDTDTAGRLYAQVSDLEAAFMMETLEERINNQLKS